MSGGWTVVNSDTNKSQPIQGTSASGVAAPFVANLPSSQDPVQKFRVSNPQSLIDTDFEYGNQPTKWETLSLTNQRASFWYDPTAPITITGMSGAGTRVVTVTTTTPPSLGSSVFIQSSTNYAANGWFYVDSVSAGVNFTYIADLTIGAGSIFDPARTYVFSGNPYSQIGVNLNSTVAFTYSGTTITCTTASAHGLNVGNPIYVFTTTASTNPPNGAWIVSATPTANTLQFVVLNVPTGTIGNTANALTLYARPNGYVEQRPFDGGVQFSSGSLSPNSAIIRQTRRYFRYQSGKGIQFSTGSNFKAALYLDQITSSGTTCTVNCTYPHNLASNATVTVSGATDNAYNGTFAINVLSDLVFTYTALTTPNTSPASGGLGFGNPVKVSPQRWFGSTARLGMLDLQNGVYFEFDGQQLYACLRSSTNQLTGTAAVTNASAVVTGVSTLWATQLLPNDYIVIRGSSYRVLQINSNTAMIVTPEYKGTTLASGVIISKTIDYRVPQSQWYDKCDGTGPSGYNLDLTRMQMWYIDYSWYGAGVVRYGMRATNGQVTYVTQIQNNNIQTEAFMRSGNLPAHYESECTSPATSLTSTLSNVSGAGVFINVLNTNDFPPSGTIKITQNGASGNVEFINYSAKTTGGFLISARAQTGGQGTAQTFTFSATAPIAVELASGYSAPALGHWGSSVIMDGRFDDDKSLLFNFGTRNSVTIASGAAVPIIAIRLAPSVDNGFTSVLGGREIVNRMQLKLVQLGLITTGPFLINLILNGRPTGFSGAFASPGGSSLAQVASNTNTSASIIGGESAAAAYTNTNGETTLDLTQVRDLGNSILGGGTNNVVPASVANLYPDGPDILYVVANNVSAGSINILSRLTWTEAQA
jgi:hypothetical protein